MNEYVENEKETIVASPKLNEPDSNNNIEEDQASGFMLELLVCSLIIWGCLFLSSNFEGKQILQTVNQMISQDTNDQLLKEVETEVTTWMEQVMP